MIKAGTMEQLFYSYIEQAAADVQAGASKNQKQYTQLAIILATASEKSGKDWSELFSSSVQQLTATHGAISENVAIFLDRLLRNVAAVVTPAADIAASRNTARAITNYWSDFEILETYNLNNADIIAMLRAMQNYWLDDKQTAFFNIPEQYRQTAAAGDYGALIERRLATIEPTANTSTPTAHTESISSAPTTPQQYTITNEGKEVLKDYCCSGFCGIGSGNTNYFDQFITDLSKYTTNKKAFASIVCLAWQSKTTIKGGNGGGTTFADLLRVFAMCFNLGTLPNDYYKPSKLDPQKYAGVFYYIK